MKIEITEQDIKNGNPCDSEGCAVSQALIRYFNTYVVSTSIKKWKVFITINDQPYFVDKKDNQKVVDFIYAFDNLDFQDNAVPPKPITFKLNQ
jgi:hypothetical protein